MSALLTLSLTELRFKSSRCALTGVVARSRPGVQDTNLLHHLASSTQSPQPRVVGTPTRSTTSTESKPRTQPISSSAVVKKRRPSGNVALPQPKRAKPEPDDEEDDEEWLTFPPGLFPPGFGDDYDIEVDTQKQSVQVDVPHGFEDIPAHHHQQVSNRDRRVERILADRVVRISGQPVRQYRVKWLGCPDNQNSWEIEDDLRMADVKLKNYKADRAVRYRRARTSYERQERQERQTVIIDLTQEDD